MRVLVVFLVLCFLSHHPRSYSVVSAAGGGGYGGGSGEGGRTTTSLDIPRRMDHLDYLDVSSMEYYLTAPQQPYDVAILLYAQWCNNCHALAPIWDQISKIIKAGTTQSNVIIGLFDCEADMEHAEICSQLHVTHYPTLVYISLAGQHHKLSRKSPHHVTQFPGNWQYGDALLDWISTMHFLSNWHRSSRGKKLRKAMFRKTPTLNSKTGDKEHDAGILPIGVPKDIRNEQELVQLQSKYNQTENLIARSSNFVDVLLTPIMVPDTPIYRTDGNKNYTDVFAYLHKENAWTDDHIPHILLRTCVQEVSLDYCSRITTQYMDHWIASLDFSSGHQITETEFELFQNQMNNELQENEPFCTIIDDCITTGFVEDKCQPETCPFQDMVACRYLTSCLTKQLQHEYAEAMDLFVDASAPPPSDKQPHAKKKKNKDEEQPIDNKKKNTGFKWGL